MGKRVRKTLQRAGDFRGDVLEDFPEDDHRDGQDADDEFDQPPNNEDGAEEDLEEGFHGLGIGVSVWDQLHLRLPVMSS